MMRIIAIAVGIFALVSHAVRAVSEEVAANVSSSTCFCTTVPCPAAGPNYLTVGWNNFLFYYFNFLYLYLGGGAVGTYVYVNDDAGSVTSPQFTFPSSPRISWIGIHWYLQQASLLMLQISVWELILLLALKIMRDRWMTTASRTATLVTFWRITSADLETNLSISSLKIFMWTVEAMLHSKERYTIAFTVPPPQRACRGPSPMLRHQTRSQMEWPTAPSSLVDHAPHCIRNLPTKVFFAEYDVQVTRSLCAGWVSSMRLSAF